MAERKPTLTTPFGIASYPWLTKPDTKFNDDGVYSVNLILSEEESESLIEQIDEEMEASLEKALEDGKEKVESAKTPAAKKKAQKALDAIEASEPPYKAEEDDDGNETGNYIFHFKMNAVGKDKKTGEAYDRRPKLYDAKGTDITKTLKGYVGSGSNIRVSFVIGNPWYMVGQGAGVTLYLGAVQIKELVSGGATAEGFGFDSVDGFTAEESSTPSEFEDSDESDQQDNGDGDF